MPRFCPNLPGRQVHTLLKKTLREIERAEQNAVLWFDEVMKRKLYQELGYSSIHQYATEALGFSAGKTSQFIRLVADLRELPRLRRSMANGEIGWTKAREVAKVASAKTQLEWIEEAKRSSSRDLEKKVKVVKRKAAAARRADPNQAALDILPPVGKPDPAQKVQKKAVPTAKAPTFEVTVTEVPATLSMRFSSEQLARHEALQEQIAKENGGPACHSKRPLSREELYLAALEEYLAALRANQGAGANDNGAAGNRAEAGPSEAKKFPRGNWPSPPPYQIIIYQCETCGRGEIRTRAGAHPLSPAALQAAACDARVAAPAKQNRATIPPAVRRVVLTRDGHRCRMKGCGQTRFLAVHHLVPRSEGGKNDPENLVTLCTHCHRLLHERFLKGEKRQEHLIHKR